MGSVINYDLTPKYVIGGVESNAVDQWSKYNYVKFYYLIFNIINF